MTERRDHVNEENFRLRRTLGWMDLVIGSIGDAVCVTDRDGRLLFVNIAFATLVNENRVFLLGSDLSQYFSYTKTEQPLAEFSGGAEQLTGAQGGSEICEWHDPDGRHYVFRISTRVLPNDGETVYLIQDITREYELLGLKNRFIDLASHQLRTPMTAIMAYSHMLRDGMAGDLTPDQMQLASTVVTASERMTGLVNDLLKITRAQNGMHSLQLARVDFAALFDRLEEELQGRCAQRSLRLRMTLPAKPATIRSDVAVLHEVISNLLVNAIQYTPEGGAVRLSLRNLKSGGVCLSVSDTGIGIPESHQPFLFEQFSRADNALEARPEGTGLGLYLVKLLLVNVKGTIGFTSRVGEGTTFRVELPKQL
jgi:signal transduction histidine kinase